MQEVGNSSPPIEDGSLLAIIDKNLLPLGAVQFVVVEEDITIANMIGQHGIRNIHKQPPIRYETVKHALELVSKKALETNASVHMPRIGCGLAGGSWIKIEEIIRETLLEKNIDVYAYDLNE